MTTKDSLPWGGLMMKCPKCKGRMQAETYYNFVRSYEAWRCTSCGEIIDQTILVNRERPHKED
jgi:transposase-like protein